MDKEGNNILKRQKPWRDAYFYQKTEVLYHLTYAFCKRFLSQHGDRTVDQMIQAARSGKQNIIEGTEDGVTSTEMHIKLLNVARSSIQELREDYRDFLLSRHLTIWTEGHERYEKMRAFCRTNNKVEKYQAFFEVWTNEEMANTALTLCYMVDAMLNRHLISLEHDFVTHGGIKERMYAARTGYRQKADEELARLKNELAATQKTATEQKSIITEQKKEIERLKALLEQHNINY